MELIEITINKYRSIIEPLTIKLNPEDMFYTFIGKNGSGKTNILQAIKLALSKYMYGYNQNKKEEISVDFTLQLTDEEIKTYFNIVDNIDVTKKTIEIHYDGNTPEIKLTNVPILKISIDEYKDVLLNARDEFVKARDSYISSLERLEFDDYDKSLIIDATGAEYSLRRNAEFMLDRIKDNLDSQIKSFDDYFDKLFAKDFIKVSDGAPYFGSSIKYIGNLVPIDDNLVISMSPLLRQVLGISDEKLANANKNIKKKIKKINASLETAYISLKTQYDKFNSVVEKIADIFSSEYDDFIHLQSNRESTKLSFVKKLRHSCMNGTYFIDNEKSILFSSGDIRRNYESEINRNFYNDKNPIWQAFDNFLDSRNAYQTIQQDDKTVKESIFNLKEVSIDKIENWIEIINSEFFNSIIPDFDKQGINGFELKLDDNKLMLYVIEKNNSRTPFNNTSLGRRWYLTYYFVKSIMQEGDMLILDEPAAFLHPSAQEEIKNDLIALANERNIKVFVATHSAYMLTDNWENIYNIEMTDKGTIAHCFTDKNNIVQSLQSDLGLYPTNNILFNLSKTIVFVEGIGDKVCLQTFAKLFGIDFDSNYYIHVCDGDSILQLIYFCIENNLKHKAILDDDNHYKPSDYKDGHSMYKKCIEAIDNDSNNCKFIGKGINGCIEDYFDDDKENNYKYFNTKLGKYKIANRKISHAKSLNDFPKSTVQYFEQVFKDLGMLP